MVLDYFLKYRQGNQPELRIDRENRKLRFSYTPKTNRALYDICDTSGNVLCTGAISDSGIIDVCIKKLNKGIYTFCVVDGDELAKCKFELMENGEIMLPYQ